MGVAINVTIILIFVLIIFAGAFVVCYVYLPNQPVNNSNLNPPNPNINPPNPNFNPPNPNFNPPNPIHNRPQNFIPPMNYNIPNVNVNVENDVYENNIYENVQLPNKFQNFSDTSKKSLSNVDSGLSVNSSVSKAMDKFQFFKNNHQHQDRHLKKFEQRYEDISPLTPITFNSNNYISKRDKKKVVGGRFYLSSVSSDSSKDSKDSKDSKSSSSSLSSKSKSLSSKSKSKSLSSRSKSKTINICNVNDAIDVCHYSEDVLYLLKDGRIMIEEPNGGIRMVKSKINFNRIVMYDGLIFGLKDGLLYRLFVNSYDSGSWEWIPISDVLRDIQHIQTDNDGSFLWLQNKNHGYFYDTRELTSVTGIHFFNSKRKMVATIRSNICYHGDKAIENAKDVLVDYEGFVNVLNDDKFRFIREVRWKPVYIN